MINMKGFCMIPSIHYSGCSIQMFLHPCKKYYFQAIYSFDSEIKDDSIRQVLAKVKVMRLWVIKGGSYTTLDQFFLHFQRERGGGTEE